MENTIITRSEAKEQGLKHYFEGKTCKHGHLSKRYVKNNSCWECASLRTKAYMKANRDRVNTMIRNKNLEKRYGINIEGYDILFAAQNGVCAICLSSCTRENLSVDHCHTTGKVRGLLCNACNIALGKLKDNPDSIRRMLSYILHDFGS